VTESRNWENRNGSGGKMEMMGRIGAEHAKEIANWKFEISKKGQKDCTPAPE
jgi:hypothetical protein